MAKQDYYQTLGVQKNVSGAELKKAYRRLAMKFHPDRNPDNKQAEEKFKEIQEAYDILSDSKKRAAYDQFGHAGVDPSMRGAGGGANADFSDMFGDFGDIFGDIFGGGGRRGGQAGGGARAQRGADLRYNLTISLEQAVHGDSVQIRIPKLEQCSDCHGSGAAKGSAPSQCGTCHGQGQVRMQQGFFSIQQTCPHCHGTGQVITNPCQTCHGQGRVEKSKTLSVKIPVGIDEGDRIRLAGEGEAGMHGAPAGDLYVQIKLKPHAIFKRRDNDLYCEIPISFSTATIGGEITVPTLSGEVKIKIPAETQTGKIFRIRSKGVTAVRGGSVGDLLCEVTIETPVKLNSEQKELLRQFEDSLLKDKRDHSPRSKSWFEGVKNFFN